jgi:hypothetical protein
MSLSASPNPTPTPPPPDQDDGLSPLHRLGSRLVMSMRRAIQEADLIDPLQRWTRLRSALETAAAAAQDWPQMVSEMARKLQVVVLPPHVASSICSMAPSVAADWQGFRETCEREALYVIALAQVEADADRQRFEARQAERKTRATAGVAAHEEGIL